MPFRFYAHLSWTTWARLPLIDEGVAHFLGPFLLAEAKRHGARVVEIGIVRDHVHLLLELPPVYDAPRLVQGLKGSSARIANRDGHSGRGSVRWEKGYDFRSVGIRQLPGVTAYVRDQELKHGPPKPSRRLSLQGSRSGRAGASAPDTPDDRALLGVTDPVHCRRTPIREECKPFGRPRAQNRPPTGRSSANNGW